MAILTNIVSLFRANVKLFFIKLFHPKSLKYNLFSRIRRGVEIRLDKTSSISLGKGVLINSGTVVSATDGGTLIIGVNVGLNNNTMLFCHQKVVIGENTIMGPGVFIYDHDHCFDKTVGVKRNDFKTSPVIIGKNCWIGAGSIILRGSIIGDNCLVAAGSVVRGTYEPGSVVIQKRQEIIK